MLDPINQQNLKADTPAYGKWAKLASSFADETPLRQLFELFIEKGRPQLPTHIELAEYGSAEGLVGEYFKKHLSERHTATLTLFDAVVEHLNANKNPETKKIQSDLLELKHPSTFHVGLVRSVLHYFSKPNQVHVLENIRDTLTENGYVLIQAFIQNPKNLSVYLELNKLLGKAFQLISAEEVLDLMNNAGFKNCTALGSIPTFHFTSRSLQERYQLPDKTIQDMRAIIAASTPENKRDFRLTDTDFEVPVPYQVFLGQK
jgi:hypothetical protein